MASNPNTSKGNGASKRMSNERRKARMKECFRRSQERKEAHRKAQDAREKANLKVDLTPWQQAKATRKATRLAKRELGAEVVAVLDADTPAKDTVKTQADYVLA